MCGYKFDNRSNDFKKHIATCLSDYPTYYEMPPKNSHYKFKNKKNVLPKPYICYADLETKNVSKHNVCHICDALLETEIDEENIQRIVKGCNHPKLPYKSCAECSVIILNIQESMKKLCVKNNHEKISKEDVLCEECEKIFIMKKDEKIHTHTNMIECGICIDDKDYCSHSCSEKLRQLSPLVFSITVIDNITKDVFSSYTYGGQDCIQRFYESLETLYDELSTVHENRCQNYPSARDMNTSSEIKDYRKKHSKCWVCDVELDEFEKLIDHCHITG